MFYGLHGDSSFQLDAGFGEWMKREAMNGAWEQFGFGEFGYWGLKEKKKEIRNKKLKITWTLGNIWPSAQVWVPQTVENIEWWETENMCQMGGV